MQIDTQYSTAATGTEQNRDWAIVKLAIVRPVATLTAAHHAPKLLPEAGSTEATG
jgi:hypothetical protein